LGYKLKEVEGGGVGVVGNRLIPWLLPKKSKLLPQHTIKEKGTSRFGHSVAHN